MYFPKYFCFPSLYILTLQRRVDLSQVIPFIPDFLSSPCSILFRDNFRLASFASAGCACFHSNDCLRSTLVRCKAAHSGHLQSARCLYDYLAAAYTIYYRAKRDIIPGFYALFHFSVLPLSAFCPAGRAIPCPRAALKSTATFSAGTGEYIIAHVMYLTSYILLYLRAEDLVAHRVVPAF